MSNEADVEKIIATARKLFALGKNNENENEAASAIAKGMELLEAHNLSMAVIDRDSGMSTKRKDAKRNGGLYQWQRDLWSAVAELNFCYYEFKRGLRRGESYEHRLIGKPENVTSTELMAEYLQDTTERLATDYGKRAFPGASRFIKELIAYREGIATRLVHRLWELRRQRLNEEHSRQAEQAAAARHPGAAPGTGIVLASVIQTETDLNWDYICNLEPGTTSRRRAEADARQAAAKAAADAELAKQAREWEQFEKDNPEEAARILAERAMQLAKETRERNERWAREDEKARNRPVRYRKMTSQEQRRNSAEFRSGYDKGGDVGLDKQVGNNQAQRIK